MYRLAIMVLLVTWFCVAAHKDANAQEDSKTKAAVEQIKLLTKAVDVFTLRADGEFPSTLDDLLRTKPPILQNKDALLDPWKKPFRYDVSGPRNSGLRPDIWTVTPANETIGNWPKTLNALQFEVKVKAAQALAAALSKAVDTYALKNNGKYPDKLDDLLRDTKVISKEILLDPWDRSFRYDKSGPKNKGKRPDIWTVPPNTKEPVGNWQPVQGDPVQALYAAKVEMARLDLHILSSAVRIYHENNKRFPNTLDQLTEGKSPLAEEKTLVDPWGRRYLYDPTGPNNNGTMPDIWTESPMRERIGNWQKEEKKK